MIAGIFILGVQSAVEDPQKRALLRLGWQRTVMLRDICYAAVIKSFFDLDGI